MKPVFKDIISKVLENNRKVYYKENKELLDFLLSKKFIEEIKTNDNSLLELILCSFEDDDKLFIAKEVIRVKYIIEDGIDDGELKIRYLLRLFRQDSEYMKKVISKTLFRKIANNITYTPTVINDIRSINDIKYLSVLLETKKFNIEELDLQVLDLFVTVAGNLVYKTINKLKTKLKIKSICKEEHLEKINIKELIKFLELFDKQGIKIMDRILNDFRLEENTSWESVRLNMSFFGLIHCIPGPNNMPELYQKYFKNTFTNIYISEQYKILKEIEKAGGWND